MREEADANDAEGRVGLLCNCSQDADPKQQLSPSLVNRAILIAEHLSAFGIGLFLYSPRDVTTSGSVEGYEVDGHELIATRQTIPRVNANWTYGTRRLINEGMGYQKFKRWTRENRIEIYVPYALSELVSNKRKAFDAVREYDEDLHPYTEDYTRSAFQLEAFLKRSEVVFVKPRAGNRGNRIFVLRKSDDGYSIKYYDDGAQRPFSRLTLEAAIGVIDVAAVRKRYVVQEGIESLRYEGAVFDVRVVMVHDGTRWHSILETRLAPENSDLSNVFQGGSIQVTEDLFESMFGKAEGHEMEEKIRRISLGIANHFEAIFPSQIMELGLDFVLDRERGLHLVEVNSKPGIAGFGSETKIFDWQAENEPYYQKWVYPHVRHLAEFLRSKVEES